MSRFKVRYIFLLVLLFFTTAFKSFGQNSTGFELQRTFEKVRMTDYDDFVLGNSTFLLTHDKNPYRLAYGLEIQEALFGEFGGLYVFGLITELDYGLSRFPISINVNAFLGGGGGAGAPDGSGLAFRYGGGVKYALNANFNVLARYSNYNFPSGNMGGAQFQWGFSYGVSPILYSNSLDVKMANQSASIQSIFMFLDAQDAASLKSDYQASIVGVEYAARYNKHLQGLIRLQAAISSEIDGFMAYYTGLSTKLCNYKSITWSAQTLIGSCGGGGVNTSGGFAYLIETGLDFKFPRKSISISRGYNASYAGSFSADYVQLGFKYHFESSFLLGTKGHKLKTVEGVKSTFLGLRTGLNIHKAPNALDKNGLLYKDMTLMYFGLAYPIHPRFDLLGETRWAMGGDYGAYAEGVFGLSASILNCKKFNIRLPVHIVVAGGGGIDVGKGVGVQFNLSVNYSYSEHSKLSFSVGKLDMIQGNYKPLSIHLSLRRNLLIHHK